mgnify:CR=1 FL=1
MAGGYQEALGNFHNLFGNTNVIHIDINQDNSYKVKNIIKEDSKSEILELKASKEGSAMGSVVESSLDKGRGPIATILVQSGTLNKKDYVLVGKEYGRIRAMYDEFNKEITSAALLLGYIYCFCSLILGWKL